MKRFVDLKISTKLIVGFLIIAFIAAIIGAIGLVSLYKLWKDDRRMYEENTLALEYAGSASTTFVLIRYNTYKLSVLTDQAKLQDVADNSTMLLAALSDYLTKCDSAIVKEHFKAQLGIIVAEWENTYQPGMQKLTQLALSGDSEGAQALVPGLAQLGTTMYSEFVSFLDVLAKDADLMSKENSTVALNSGIAILVITVIGVIVSVILAGYIARIISRPLNRAVDIADKLAIGDLDAELNEDGKRLDEIGKLSKSFDQLIISTKNQVQAAKLISEGDLTVNIDLRSEKDQMGQGITELLRGLRELVSSIYAASEQVSDGSNMLSNSSMELSQGATDQASAVEELTASIEEIAAQTNVNAKNAEEASKLAKNSRENAEQSNTKMKSMLTAMDDINDSSRSISKIIKVIDDIAFQTNILALNAAVEAARAGQHGKGFAVVAEEVRTLAARSATAAKETTDMIEHSIRKVDAGTKIAVETAESLGRIVDQIEKAAELNINIANASKEQALGIDQINRGIIQVSQVVQTNAATAEESAAASEELSGQAEHLKEIVSVFRLGNGREVAMKKEHTINLELKQRSLIANSAKRLHAGSSDFGKY